MHRGRELSCDGFASRLAWSPDGTLLAVAGGSLHVFDVASGQRAWSAPIDGYRTVAFAPGGRVLAASHGDRCVVRAVSDGAELARMNLGIYAITSLAWSSDERLVLGEHWIRGTPAAVPTAFQSVPGVQIRTASGDFVTRLPMRIITRAVVATSTAIYAAGHADEVRAFESAAPRWTAKPFPRSAFGAFLHDVALAPAGDRLAIAGWALVRTLSTTDGKATSRPVRDLAHDSISIAWAPHALAVGHTSGAVTLLAADSLRKIHALEHAYVAHVRWSPDGTSLAVATRTSVVLWHRT